MDPDLVHATGARAAEDDAGLAVERQLLEFRATVLAFGRNPADADLVADHLDWLVTHDRFAAHETGKREIEHFTEIENHPSCVNGSNNYPRIYDMSERKERRRGDRRERLVNDCECDMIKRKGIHVKEE